MGISHFRAAIRNPEIFLKSAVRSLFQFPCVFGNSGLRIYPPLDLAKIGNFSTRVSKGISHFRVAIRNAEIFLKSAVRSLFQFPWVFANSGFRIYPPLDLAKLGNFSTRVSKGISHFRAAIRNPEIFLKSVVRSLFQFPWVFANSGFRIYPPLDLATIGNFSTRVSKGISHFRVAIRNAEIFLKSAVRSLFQFPWVFANSGLVPKSPNES